MSGGKHLYDQTHGSVGQRLTSILSSSHWMGLWEMLIRGTEPPFLQKVKADSHLEHSGASLCMGGHKREVLSIEAPQPLSSRRFSPPPLNLAPLSRGRHEKASLKIVQHNRDRALL